MKQPLRNVLYVRSHDSDTDQHIQQQIQLLQETCERENHVVTAVYIDKGFSGRSLDRPELQRLLADANEQRFDIVRTHRLSQLTRRAVDVLYLCKTLKGHNVTIVADDFDPTSASGMFSLQMMNVMIDHFPRMVRKEVTANTEDPNLTVPYEHSSHETMTIRESDAGAAEHDGGHS